jgi:hypothetical protein
MRGGAKTADARYWARIVEINFLLFLNLAAILKTFIFMSTVINFVSNNYKGPSHDGRHDDFTINLCASVFN